MSDRWFVRWAEYRMLDGKPIRRHFFVRFPSCKAAMKFYVLLIERPSAWEIEFPKREIGCCFAFGDERKEGEIDFDE